MDAVDRPLCGMDSLHSFPHVTATERSLGRTSAQVKGCQRQEPRIGHGMSMANVIAFGDSGNALGNSQFSTAMQAHQ